MKKTFILLVVFITIAAVFVSFTGTFAATDRTAYDYASGTDIKNHENELVSELLKTEEDVQYYAYLDLDSAEEEIKPAILTARNIIIHRYSWVVEGRAVIEDRSGNVVRELPYFYDLFPEDWDIPVTKR